MPRHHINSQKSFMTSYLPNQTSENNKSGIIWKLQSFAARSKKNFGNRIINVATVAIYVSNSSKFSEKIWLRHTLTPPHAKPIGRIWPNQSLLCSKFIFTNLQSGFIRFALLEKKLSEKMSRGGGSFWPPPDPNRVKRLEPLRTYPN